MPRRSEEWLAHIPVDSSWVRIASRPLISRRARRSILPRNANGAQMGARRPVDRSVRYCGGCVGFESSLRAKAALGCCKQC